MHKADGSILRTQTCWSYYQILWQDPLLNRSFFHSFTVKYWWVLHYCNWCFTLRGEISPAKQMWKQSFFQILINNPAVSDNTDWDLSVCFTTIFRVCPMDEIIVFSQSTTSFCCSYTTSTFLFHNYMPHSWFQNVSEIQNFLKWLTTMGAADYHATFNITEPAWLTHFHTNAHIWCE